MSSLWIPITYRDFYDIPRVFVAERGGKHFVFDCPFDDAQDEYPDHYRVYRLDPDVVGSLATMSWHNLSSHGRFVRAVPVASVEFDHTRRKSIRESVFDLLEP